VQDDRAGREGRVVRAVTIGLPLYNDARYLSKAMDSLLAQTFTDFEILISDNASTDRSSDICDQYVKKDSRVRYVRQERNLGVRHNFLFLLNQASSEFFMWAASDDRWHPDFLQECVDALRRDPGCAVAFCPFVYMDEDDQIVDEVQDYEFSGATPLRRLLRLNSNFAEGRDSFWYGLYRLKLVQDMHVRYWWWINAEILTNTAYPVLTFILARGNYAHVGKHPLWINRLHRRSGSRHSGKFHGRPVADFFAFLLRQINLACYCVIEVFHARRSVCLTATATPIIVMRCGVDIVRHCSRVICSIPRKITKIIRREGGVNACL
jgi:glycosyltransferase involved in cell wall biosynthesis